MGKRRSGEGSLAVDRLAPMAEAMASRGIESLSLSYALGDIEQLERQGKTKRSRPNRLPDFYSLPNVLRTLGAYLDAKEAELIELHKRPLTLTLLYRNRDGHPDFEERSIASFYDFFLKLHGRRDEINKR